MKKYTFFIGTLCDGGAERVVSILSGKMAEKGMLVEIVTYYDKNIFYEIYPKVKITSVERVTGTKNKFKNIIWIRKYFKKNAKIVISFLAPFNMLAIISTLGTGVPIIVADRNDPTKVPTNKTVRKIRDILYMFADGIVLQTKKNKEYFGKIVQRKSTVIYNPVNMKGSAGSALHTEKEKKIVSVGRLIPQKNQKILIKAFANVVKEFPDYQLVIYGEGSDRQILEELVKELEIQKNVLMPGSINALHEKMKSAELFVLSSDYEGMPNALIEAMCLGLPVVSTKVSGATDLIQDGKNGFLVDCGNTEQLTEAMLEMLGHPQKMKAYAIENAKLVKRLEVDSIAEEWITFIDRKERE